MWLKEKVSNVIFILECILLVFKGFFEGIVSKYQSKEVLHISVKDYLLLDEDLRQILEDDINNTLEIIEYQGHNWTRIIR